MYSFESRIRYSETGPDGNLDYYSLLNYFQDCSTFQSNDMGYGVEYLFNRGLAWVVNYWQIDIFKYPHLGDKVTIGTFPYEFKGFIGLRNFLMLDENGEYIAKANSIWTLLDMKTGRPSRPTKEHMAAYPLSEKMDMEYLSRKIALLDDMEKGEIIEIKKYHLDTNNHVNNGQFVRIAIEALGEERCPKRVRAEYKKQVHLGDSLIPFIAKNENRTVIDLQDTEGNSCCVVEIWD